MDVPIITIGEPNKSNLDKLDKILDTLKMSNNDELKEFIEIHPNSYGIIELLEEIISMNGVKNTLENRYKFYSINRDLKQLGSPVSMGNYLLTNDDINQLPHEHVEVSREDIIEMHIDLRHKQGCVDDYLNWYPTKRNIRRILIDLMENDVIRYYAVEDLFNDISDDKEWDELMGPDDRVQVLKIY